MTGRVMVALVLGAVLASRAAAVRAEGSSAVQDKKPPPVVYEVVPESERLDIDGSKNPEMIPQWDAWLAAFDIIARKSDLPTEVHKQVSTEEAALVVAAAAENAKNFLALQQRVLKIMPELQTVGVKAMTERTQAMNIEFRWQLLDIRDRLLAKLNPAGRAALAGYVESLKAGMRVLVPKKEYAYYRQPQ